MQEIKGTTDFCITERTAVTFGKFDGIHRGHRVLLDAITDKKRDGLKCVVFTFSAAPETLTEKEKRAYLSLYEEKKKYFEQIGIDYLIEFPFTPLTRQITAVSFIEDIIAKRLNAAYIAVGRDFGFGYKRSGNAELLKNMSLKCGYEIDVFEKIKCGDEEISSTLIRRALQEGRIESVNEMLGRPYSFTGRVIHGRALGHTIGFATMNLSIDIDKAVPPCGVYLSKVKINSGEFMGITNIGHRPTVEPEGQKSDLLLEVHLLQYNCMAYGEEIEVFLYHYQRPERKFPGLKELTGQLKNDESACEAYFACNIQEGALA